MEEQRGCLVAGSWSQRLAHFGPSEILFQLYLLGSHTLKITFDPHSWLLGELVNLPATEPLTRALSPLH